MRSAVIRAAKWWTLCLALIPAVCAAQTQGNGPGPADLQALGFYLQQNDQVSAAAETRRLRAEFPGWVPSDTPAAQTMAEPSTEVDTAYRQIAAGDLAGARATLAATQTTYPAWQPPDELLALLDLAEGQIQLDAALLAGDADGALQIAARTPDLLRCDRINNAWRIAQTQEKPAATATYRAIIGACTAVPDIIATLEKSANAATDADLTALFDTALSRFPADTAAFAALQTRLMQGRGVVMAVAEAPVLPNVRPRSRSSQPPAPNPAPTVRNAPASTGGSHACTTTGATSAARLVASGWCAYNLDRPLEALAAFKQAEANLSGASRRDARFGMTLAYLKLNMTEDAARLVAATQLTAKQRVDAESIILDQRGVRAFQKKQYRQAIGYFNALEQISGRLRRDLAMLRGYAYLNNGDRAKARDLFQTLHDQLATAESRAAMQAAQ